MWQPKATVILWMLYYKSIGEGGKGKYNCHIANSTSYDRYETYLIPEQKEEGKGQVGRGKALVLDMPHT